MDLQRIIDKFKNENGFVDNIDNIVNYLKENNMDIEAINQIKIQILKYNQNLNKQIEKENQEFERMFKNRQVTLEEEVEPILHYENPKIKYESDSLEIDISYYKIQIDNCEDLNILETLLPKRTTENFNEIMDCILLSLLEEEMEYRKLYYECGESLENEVEALEYVELLRKKFKIIKNYRDHKEVIENKVEEIKNRLVFLTTTYGNICALSDIKDIPESNYEDILKLLNSIIDGTFKNAKTFNLFGTNRIVSEVKGFKQRICFDKLESDIYIINSIFIKKSDNGLSYRNSLVIRDNLYRNMENEIKDKLKGPDREKFLEENALITDEIINILKNNVKVKSLGDNSGKIN